VGMAPVREGDEEGAWGNEGGGEGWMLRETARCMLAWGSPASMLLVWGQLQGEEEGGGGAPREKRGNRKGRKGHGAVPGVWGMV
jgi:hypothetical protein